MQANQQQLDSIDKQLLNEIQWVFPLCDRPFLEISKRYNLTEQDVIKRIHNLKSIGLIRQINAIFDTRRLGYKSALIAFSVDPKKIEYIANRINEHPGVSHNYERNHEYNMWFTIAVPPYADMKKELEKMSSISGVLKYRLFPTLKLYKIGVRLDMVNDDLAKPLPIDEVKTLRTEKFQISDRDIEFIRQLQKDLPIIEEPFKSMAKSLYISTEELFAKAKQYENIGIMRRFAAILRHREAGFSANGMVVWKVPETIVDDVGYKLAAYPQVSHCYRRPVYEDWPYNLFSMIHARSFDSAEKIAKEMSNTTGLQEYKILFSTREFKKERVKYFEEQTYK